MEMIEVDPQSQVSMESGAPGDVTMSTTQQFEQLQQQMKRLETENKVLHGRIRGYKTLGDLLQEAKEENKKLAEEKTKLKQRLDTYSSISESLSNHPQNPTETEVPQTTESIQNKDMTENPDMTQKTELTHKSGMTPLQDLTNKVTEDPTETTLMRERSVASIPEKSRPPDLPEEVCGSIREVTAMQESISEGQNDLSRTNESENSELKDANISKNLELDSDRFDEPEYEKIGRKLAGTPGKPGSMSSMSHISSISSGPDEKFHFPSLSSGTPQRVLDVRPKVYNDFDTKPSISTQESGLSIQMQRVLQMTSTEGGQDLALKFRKMSEDIARTEEDAKKYKSLAYTFAQENQKLKTALTMEIKELKNQNYELRQENKRLLTLVKKLEHSRDNLSLNSDSLTSQTQVMDWVKVDKPKRQVDSELFQEAGDDASLTGDMDSVMANVRELRKKNQELKDANQSWNHRWQQLTKEWSVKVEQMKLEVAQYKQEAEAAVQRERQLKIDAEKMVSNAKSQAHEEESAKEDALNKLHQANNQIRALQEQTSELEQRLDTCVRDKHNLEAEISVLKSRSHGTVAEGNSSATPCDRNRRKTNEDLKTEIEVLRQQLTVFEEDFDRERQDRAAAQSTRDDLEKTLESVVNEKDVLSRKIKQLDQKLKSQESVMQQALKRNENLQSQVRDVQTRNQQLQEQLQAAMNQSYQMRYQPFPVYTNQPIQGLNPQTQMGGMGMIPQSPQASGYHHMPMHNQPMPFMNYQQMAPARPTNDRNTGMWNCQECTFANIPSRTVCEMCGRLKRQTESAMTEPVLMSREVVHPPQLSRGIDVPDENSDLVTDNGIFQ